VTLHVRPNQSTGEPYDQEPEEPPTADETGGSPQESAPRPGPSAFMRSSLAWLVALCTYLPLAALGFWPVWQHWSAQMNGCNCWDQLEQEWYVQWVPSALAHGQTVLVTHHIYAPDGVNLMWNASVVALGTAFAPVTEALGVVHAFSILLTLSLALSASTMFLLLRRWTAWLPAAWLGGLVYGFSTLAVQEAGLGRLNLSFDALPPLMVLVVVKLVREEWSPVVGGSVLGLLVAVQLLISEEILLITLLLVGLTLIVLAVVHRTEVIDRGMDVLRTVLASALTFFVISGYPLYVQFTGPYRITGPPQSRAQIALFSSDLLSPVVPGATQWFDPAWASRISSAFSAALAGEVTTYVGLPLLALVLVSVVLLRSRAIVRVFTLVALGSFLLSMGPQVLVRNHHTGIPGPYALLVHLPFLGDIIPSRLALGFWFAIAVLFAVGLDTGRDWLHGAALRWSENRDALQSRAQITRRRTRAKRAAGIVAVLVGVGVVIPLVPNWPYDQQPATVPTFFTTSDVQHIPFDSLAVTYPYPLTATAWPMLWQADSDMRFRMLGGYAIAPGPDGTGTFFSNSNPMEYCLLVIFGSGSSKYCNPTQLATSLSALGVTSVIAGNDEPHIALARSVIDQTLGAQPRQIGGVSLWQCVPVRAGRSCRWR